MLLAPRRGTVGFSAGRRVLGVTCHGLHVRTQRGELSDVSAGSTRIQKSSKSPMSKNAIASTTFVSLIGKYQVWPLCMRREQITNDVESVEAASPCSTGPRQSRSARTSCFTLIFSERETHSAIASISPKRPRTLLQGTVRNRLPARRAP
jgi:hypothetical protein